MDQFKGKVAIVTGGSSGIGKATALELAGQGASVVIASRNNKSGNKVVQEITDQGGDAIFVKTDVTIEAQVINLVKETLDHYGRLDMAFNNAGLEQTPTSLPEQTEEAYAAIMDTNVKGVWLCLKHQIPAMVKNGGGAIVNMSSFSGAIAFAKIPLYVASKHAVVGLTKAVALEYAKSNVRINAILPGAVENTGTFERSFGGDQASIDWAKSVHPLGRLATPKEIAHAAVFLLSDKASFITGSSMVVDGGYVAG